MAVAGDLATARTALVPVVLLVVEFVPRQAPEAIHRLLALRWQPPH
jgi:hypothetical protein